MKPSSLFREKLAPHLLPTILILLAVLLDQWTKHLTVLYIQPIGSLPLIEGVLHLTYRINTGAAFSLFDAPDQRWIFLSVSTVGILVMIALLYLARGLSPLVRYSLAMIVGGGVGNMIDRVLLGYVVDMIDLRIINFAVFNVADSFVCVGAALLIFAVLREWLLEAREDARRRAEGKPGAEEEK